MAIRNHLFPAAVVLLGLVSTGLAAAAPPAEGVQAKASPPTISRGQYLVRIGGCNDCHTAGYSEKPDTTPVSQWLTGTPVGYQGPWGTSYASNLRLTVKDMTEAQWLKFARLPRLPPMPWFSLRDMTDEDLSAVYHFIRSLGVQGERMPAAVPPGGTVTTPFFVFVPQMAAPQSAARPVAQGTRSGNSH